MENYTSSQISKRTVLLDRSIDNICYKKTGTHEIDKWSQWIHNPFINKFFIVTRSTPTSSSNSTEGQRIIVSPLTRQIVQSDGGEVNQ